MNRKSFLGSCVAVPLSGRLVAAWGVVVMAYAYSVAWLMTLREWVWPSPFPPKAVRRRVRYFWPGRREVRSYTQPEDRLMNPVFFGKRIAFFQIGHFEGKHSDGRPFEAEPLICIVPIGRARAKSGAAA